MSIVPEQFRCGIHGDHDDRDIVLQPDPKPLQAWQRAWRAIADQLSTQGLEALCRALVNDDKRLIQGATTSPPPLHAVFDWPVEACDAIVFTAWQGDGLCTVAEADEFFCRVCLETEHRLGEPAAVRYFLNQYDEWSRDEMRQRLLPEVECVLAQRQTDEAGLDLDTDIDVAAVDAALAGKGGAA